jgi:molybdopterin-guanine dinucleotide biosynthesis protein A
VSGRPPSISALVLAGGAARRLGGSKCELDVGGRALLARSLGAALAASDDVLLLPGSRQLSFGSDVFPGAGPDARLRCVPDLPDGEGPLAALGAGLEAARHGWCLALACDLPFVSAALIERLRAEALPGWDAVAVATDEGLQPFPALYGTHLAPTIRARLRAGRRSLRGLLDAIAVRTLQAADLAALDPGLRSFVNVNTPADLAQARAEALR